MATFDLEIGQTVSHFRMEKKLGEGGMGAVYLAEDLTLSRRVAIKFMSRSLLIQQGNEAVRESLEKRFIREARSAAAINHPNLAQIYEANFESDNWYIAMEFIDGASLYDLLVDDKKRFSVEEIVAITRQVVSGLEFAWENYTIIHRDIKPHNVMLTRNNLVKIVDLGLAKPLASDDTQAEMPDLTGAGTPIGTPQYMAPEQATGQKDVNYLVDIFALGATLYEIGTAKKAFSGNTAPMIYMCQVQKKYTPIKELRADIPDALVALIDRMLEPKPENRISTYQEIQQALNAVPLSGDGGEAGEVTAVHQYTPTAIGQISSKTVGMEQMTLYHTTDQLIKNRYRILKLRGKSRTGIEYHCMDTQLSVECTVKSIFPGREFPEHEMPRIKANFQKLMGYSHPNLVQIRDLQQDDDTGEFFVVMELLDGHNLRDYTHRLKNELDAINLDAISPVIQLIAKSLDSVSKSLGIINHDLTPENIFLTRNDTQVKFMDYGITYPSSEDNRKIEPSEFFKFPLATPDYMSPEMWQQKTVSRPSDQYSLAVIVYEMLSDRLPFWLKDSLPDDARDDKLPDHEQQLKYLYDRVVSAPPKPLPFLKRHENSALLKALAKNPQDRYPSCEDFVQALTKGGALPASATVGMAAAVIILAAIVFLVVKPKPSESGAGVADNTGAARQTTQSRTAKVATVAGDQTTAGANADAAADKQASQTADKSKQVAMLPSPEIAEKMELDKKAKSMAHKVEAEKLRPAVSALREKLEKDPIAMEMLPQLAEVVAGADKAFEGKEFVDAVTQYKESIALGERLLTEAGEKRTKQLLSLKNDAINLKKTFEELYAELSAKERIAPRLTEVDSIVSEAHQEFGKEVYPAAIRGYKRAIDTCNDIVDQIKQEMKKEVEALKATVNEHREKVEKYKGLAHDLTEKIVKIDVTISLAETEMKKEEFEFAIEQFAKALADCKALLGLAESKFRANTGQDFTDPKTGMDFVWIASLRFWISKFEVTNGQYRKYKPTHNSRRDHGMSLNEDRQPVLWISYYDAVGFCQWLNAVSAKDVNVPDGYAFRLPTRDEWISVARCGADRLYPWGNEWPPKYGNFGNQELFPSTWQLDGYTDNFPVSAPVDQAGVNEWGVYGMAGNVWEWTSDLKSGRRGVMGGAWTEVNRATLVLDNENAYAPMDDVYDNIGIRVVLAPEI